MATTSAEENKIIAVPPSIPSGTVPMRSNSSSSSFSLGGTRVLYLVPTELGTGLTSVSLGLVRALDREGLHVSFFKPVHQPEFHASPVDNGVNTEELLGTPPSTSALPNAEPDLERSTHFLRATGALDPPEPFPIARADEALNSHEAHNRLLEDVVERFQDASQGASVVVVEGLTPTPDKPGLEALNKAIVTAINAQVILVATLTGSHQSGGDNQKEYAKLSDSVAHARHIYGARRLLGCVVNKLNAPTSAIHLARKSFQMPTCYITYDDIVQNCKIFQEDSDSKQRIFLLAAIPWKKKLMNVRTSDMAKHLGAKILHNGDMENRRVDDICLVARNVSHIVQRLRRDTLIITPGDREDILLAACMAELNGVPLAGIVLTSGTEPQKSVLDLCDKALAQTGLPVLLLESDSYVAAATASAVDREVPYDDVDRMSRVMDTVAGHIHVDVLKEQGVLSSEGLEPRLSPPAFRHQLVTQARLARKRIVLPEGSDPRIIRAAVKCQDRGIAQCVVLGDVEQIQKMAVAQGIVIPPALEILTPSADLREKYVARMVELRKHKGLTEELARAQLEDITVLATMMLAVGEVDGLVSGAVNTTANTIRPALQLIKTRPETPIVSSVFFMCLPDQVVLYGDCAINPDPNPTELASIAMESAHTAEAFGIDPKVAMISYSTGSSGKGTDVEKVREATTLVKKQEPLICIDGPLQYDAASTAEVAAKKAPQSPVAGQATVLVFPDLNTGNTTYKAVQRTANVVCIGPMLQGLRRPVNDLSRGALVDDIVYTIALTCIQATQMKQ